MAARAHKIVSSDSERLILVDADDNPIGSMSKADCHDGEGVLHRAFSLFVFNAEGELLLQQRSDKKRLWPLFWSNSCCSHPRVGEVLDEAVARRARQELGIACEPEYVYRFDYHARFGSEGSERELCSVFLARSLNEVAPNPHEIAATRFITAAELDREFEQSPDRFTPWFRMEWEALKDRYAADLERYLGGD